MTKEVYTVKPIEKINKNDEIKISIKKEYFKLLEFTLPFQDSFREGRNISFLQQHLL